MQYGRREFHHLWHDQGCAYLNLEVKGQGHCDLTSQAHHLFCSLCHYTFSYTTVEVVRASKAHCLIKLLHIAFNVDDPLHVES